MDKICAFLLVVFMALGCEGGNGALFTDGSKPVHIVMVVIDDLGWADHSVNVGVSNTNIPTPTLQSLADSGVRFTNYYTQTVCSPTRSSIMTGRYPFRMGMQHTTTLIPSSEAHIPLDVPTLPEVLKTGNYSTHMVGKWHLGNAKTLYTPIGRGFDTFLGIHQGQVDYYTKKIGNGIDFWDGKRCAHDLVGTYSLTQYSNRFDRIVHEYAESHNTLDLQRANPLFIYYSHQTVHVPLESKESVEDRCAHINTKWRNVYCAMLVELDDALGRNVASLKNTNLWPNTLLLLTTDNGGMVKFAVEKDGTTPSWPASVGSNWPLRGSKTTLFEGGTRGTAFMTGGDNVIDSKARGTKNHDLMHAVDFFAISISVVGGHRNPHLLFERTNLNLSSIDGINPFFSQFSPRSDVPININYFGTRYTAIRFDKYKLIIGDANVTDADGWWPVKEDQPRIPPPPRKHPQYMLFDVENDPMEYDDIVDLHPEMIQRGIDLIKGHMEKGYKQPQLNLPHLRGQPFLNNNCWAPFLDHDQLDPA